MDPLQLAGLVLGVLEALVEPLSLPVQSLEAGLEAASITACEATRAATQVHISGEPEEPID